MPSDSPASSCDEPDFVLNSWCEGLFACVLNDSSEFTTCLSKYQLLLRVLVFSVFCFFFFACYLTCTPVLCLDICVVWRTCRRPRGFTWCKRSLKNFGTKVSHWPKLDLAQEGKHNASLVIKRFKKFFSPHVQVWPVTQSWPFQNFPLIFTLMPGHCHSSLPPTSFWISLGRGWGGRRWQIVDKWRAGPALLSLFCQPIIHLMLMTR